jgi:hypothetical protein
LQGGVILGNASDDLLEVRGVFSSGLQVSQDNVYDLGSDANRWATGYFASAVQVADLEMSSNQIQTTNDLTIKSTSGNLTLQ